MRTAAFSLSALLIFAGCATQEPVKIVDVLCDSASCEGRLAELRQKSRKDLDASNAARLAAEECCRRKGAVEQELQAVKGAQAQAEQKLVEQGADLARYQRDLASHQEKAKADALACEATRQQLQAQAEKSLAEQGADLARYQRDLASLQEKAKADALACEATRQQLQAQAEKSLAEQGADLARYQRDLASHQEKARSDVAACEATRQQLQAQVEQKLAEQGADLARYQRDLASLQEKAKADALACEATRQQLQKHAKTVDALDRQTRRMNDLEDRLRQKLKSELGAKDVEIERLRSQLLVRVLDRILFETGSAEILPQGRGVLNTVATALAEGDETIRIEGHADIVPIGPALKKKYFSNWELSTGRASSVARYFQYNHGIEPTRMEAVGFSKYRPIAPNDSEENRQRNRRVEIVLTPWKPVVEECAQ